MNKIYGAINAYFVVYDAYYNIIIYIICVDLLSIYNHVIYILYTQSYCRDFYDIAIISINLDTYMSNNILCNFTPIGI